MTRNEFLARLRARLSGLPQNEVEERLSFYAEMIDDRIEDGLTEEEAVKDIGSVNEIAEQLIADIPMGKIVKEKIRPKHKLAVWEIILIVLSAPIWISVAAAIISVVVAVYASLWSAIVSLWAGCFGVLAASGVGLIAAGAILICTGHLWAGIAIIGAGLICAGLSVFAFLVCRVATKGMMWITKKIWRWIKKLFAGKEVSQ